MTTLLKPYRRAGLCASLLAVPALLFAANVAVAIDRDAHSVSDTLYGIFPFWAATFLGWDWLVRRAAEWLSDEA